MEEYNYKGKELFQVHLNCNHYPGALRDQLIAVGRDLDVDKLINSPAGEDLINSFRLQFQYDDGMHPNVISYWKARGMNKFIPKVGKGTKLDMICYVSDRIMNAGADERFPLMVVIPHDLFEAEGRGYVELALREHFVVMIPMSRNLEDIHSCIKYMEQNYAVDPGRVYMSGFSFPGFLTNNFALLHPELLAGIATDCHMWPYLWQRPLPWITDHAAQYKMPVVNYTGNKDFGMTVPVYGANLDLEAVHGFSTGDAHLHKPEDNLWGCNMWMKINGAPEISLDACLGSKDSDKEYERKVGLPASRGTVKVYKGIEYSICDFLSGDGLCRVRMMAMENIPHYVWGGMADMTWEFLKHFRRDPETGESICISPVELPGEL